MHHLGDFGFTAKDIGYDFAKVIKRSRDVAGAAQSRRRAIC